MSASSEQQIRVLPQVVDEVAASRPDTTWVHYPRSNDVKDGYRDITFKELQQATDRMAHWIERNVGTSTTRETFAYMGVNDIRYIFTILAATKTGYKVLLPSVRNSEEAQRSLLRNTKCTTFLHSAETKAQVKAFDDPELSLKSFEIPTLNELLDQDATSESYKGKISHDPNEIMIIIHTSGSTGLPKPIPLRNGYLATVYGLRDIQVEGRTTVSNVIFNDQPLYCSLPWFHAMGLFMMLRSIYSQGMLVLPPIGRTPNADSTLDMIKTTKPYSAFFPPSLLEDMVDIEGGLDTLKTLKFIAFAGAPLSEEVGDRIAKVATIQTLIGSTECGIIDSFVAENRKDWNYFEWAPHTGASMEPAGEGLFELVLKKQNNGLQGAFFSFPELNEWHTKDLYGEHPEKKGLWHYRGRNDDVIVLSNGEKFGPVDFEKYLEGHPSVRGALVVGQGRFQAGLLLEIDTARAKHGQDANAFLEDIWPVVGKANEHVAAHGRVWKSKIAIVPNFERAPKGSIMRRKSNIRFAREIDALYSNEGFADQLGKLEAGADLPAVKDFLRKAFPLTLPKVPQDVAEDADVFGYGVDSLQVLGLASALNHAIQKEGAHGNAISGRTIYSHPNMKSLATTIHNILSGSADHRSTRSRQQNMADMVTKYTRALPTPLSQERVSRQEKHAVILTGSTGSLGNYILEILISDPRISKVYCLNRSGDAESRQKKSFQARDTNPDFRKVEFLQSSFGKEKFGLPAEKYTELQRSVSIVIHNAWAVDFNMGLESFEDVHVAGTRRCIDFSASSQYHPHIFFVSSIASVGNWLAGGHSGFVPERYIEDNSVPLPQGYGESKHVAGRILAAAAQRSGVPATIIRAGQLAGPEAEKGLWNKQEWLPSIIASSKAVGKIPRTLGNQDTVDWVPTDTAAQVLVDLVFSRLRTQTTNPLDAFHLVNPQVVSWSELVPAIRDFYHQSGTEIEVVEFQNWLETLKKLPMTQEQVQKVPGLKLLDFYEGMAAPAGLPRLATDHTADSSATLKKLGPVSRDLMVNWLKQWGF